KKSNTSRTVIIAVSVPTAVFVLLIIFVCVILRKRRTKREAETRPLCEPVDEIESVESLQYSFETIRIATDNFSETNKLGQGGFGAVYKGRLSNGQDIAVKRLSRGSGQGDLEFKNEIILVAKLQHRNLVRLLGFGLEGNERLLVYEFVQNASLDHFIFDPTKRANLDWDRRYKIIRGVARGLLYLHEDSRLRIIHRDLKASNILLDEEMNAKISDFGMAKLFIVDQTQDETSRIVGTYGYMAPEYAMHGQFSVKSDIFSLGVLLLEIVTGQRNNCFRHGEHVEHLLSYAWRNWTEGTASNIVDPLMRVRSGSDIMRSIHIGLLCVQKNIADRPTMNAIVLMLSSNSLSLPVPSEPAFFMHSTTGSDLSLASDFNSSRVTDQSDHPNSESIKGSINEDSITEVYPR
ncbi:Cysteine rich receptor like kinase, partial [Trema orientale]